jgi:hypothetical protein
LRLIAWRGAVVVVLVYSPQSQVRGDEIPPLTKQLRRFKMATQKQFDFDDYNKLMKNANSGLKLYLAEQLLQDVQGVMVRFKSPLRNDITSIVDELAQLRVDNKKYLASRENTTSGDLDNSTIQGGSMTQPSNSADAGRVSA